MSSACRSGCAGIAMLVTGMMLHGWTKPVSRRPPSPIAELANAVARHKAMFFAEKASDRTPINYAAAVNGGLRLRPAGVGLKALEETTPVWSTMGFSWKTPSLSTR